MAFGTVAAATKSAVGSMFRIDAFAQFFAIWPSLNLLPGLTARISSRILERLLAARAAIFSPWGYP
jgi:hypothetical protein